MKPKTQPDKTQTDKTQPNKTPPDTVEGLRARLAEAEETLRAIRSGEVDAIVVSGSNGDRVFTLEGADTPYRILVEEMSEGALTIATDGLILYANRRFAKMLDVPLSKVTGSSLLQWVDERARPAMQSLLDEAAAKGESKREFELIRGAGPGGSADARGADAGGADAGGGAAGGPVLLGAVPIYLCASCLPDSEPRRLCVVVTDLTEERQHQRLVATQDALKASETRLLAASRLRDEFLATISHELRTPLNAILGWATLLKGGRLGPGKMSEAIEIIERNARAQVRLVDDLLDVSRVITGKLQLDVRPVPVLPLVQTVLESLRPTFEAREIRLETDWKQIDGGAVTNGHGASRGAGASRDLAGDMVNGDPDRLQQVIWNLLSNAVKFTPPKGTVRVSLARAATHLELRVADSGLGIKPEFLPHVFERFRQADSTTTRRHSGLGLGLAIVRHLVELHGGTVEVESEGEGHGAAFIVRLPVRAVRDRRARRSSDAAAPGSAERAEAMGANLHGVTVLVVDDQADAQALVRTVLQDAGATAIGASAVGDALELLTRFTPDVVVADIGMPGEDGYSLIRQLRDRERSRGDRMPAIALTAYGRAEDRALALESGFDAHLRKPVDTDALLMAIATAVGRVPRHN